MIIADRLGVADIPAAGLEAAAADLERVSHLCRPDSESFVNPAKTLALELAGTLPMIWGSSPLTGVAATRFGVPAERERQVPGGHRGAARGQPQPGGGVRRPLRPVARRGARWCWTRRRTRARRCRCGSSSSGTARSTRRWPAGARCRPSWRRSAASSVSELAADGDTPLQRLASLIQLIDYATVYLGIAIGVDPGPIAVISELKERIV